MSRLWVLIVGVALAGCSSTAKKFCKEAAACDEGVDEEACLADYEEAEADAAEKGCEKEFDNLQECALEYGECVDGELAADACIIQAFSFLECFGFGSGTFTYTSDTGL